MAKEQHTTQNITASNKDLEVLKKNFSHCFDKNGGFDFDKFKNELSEKEVNFSKESYGMDWLGKSYARLLASDTATTLLKEDAIFNAKEENKNSENLLIKGDNLEVLKHLSNAYYEKIKMIYIDPPYNTGSDGFVYQDDRKFTVNEFKHLTGVDEDAAKKILTFVDSKSNSHSAWLTFMYPRLYIAKQLLTDDGVIFISIDDNEVSQLKLLMDDVFGEENFVESLIWKRRATPPNDRIIGKNHEYLLVYAKNLEKVKLYLQPRSEKLNSRYSNPDNDPKGKWAASDLSANGKGDRLSESCVFDIYNPINKKSYAPPQNKCWLYNEDKINDLLSKNIIGFREKTGTPFLKRYLSEVRQGSTLPTILDKVGFSQDSAKEIKSLFNNDAFDFPKPTKLLKTIITNGVSNKNDIVLDFFAGSGTTGDAVMQLNSKGEGKRKFILAQLPEKINPKTSKIAYDFVKKELKIVEPTIFDITRERLIRAAKKIKEENKETKIDVGFKVFETTPIWEDYNLESDSFDEKLQLFDELQLTKEDLKALLITWKTNDGIALTNNLEEIDLGNYTGYYFEDKIYLMDKGFTTDNLKTLLELIDTNKKINPASIIAFGYHFESKNLREISENIKSYANKKNIDIDFITRY